MRASGVDETKAKVMFAAVYHFGPRWPDPVSVTQVPVPSSPPRTLREEDFPILAKAIEASFRRRLSDKANDAGIPDPIGKSGLSRGGASLDEIEGLTAEDLVR